MPDLDPAETIVEENTYDPRGVGGEEDTEFDEDDFDNADRGDVPNQEPEAEPEPEAEAEPEPEPEPEAEAEVDPEPEAEVNPEEEVLEDDGQKEKDKPEQEKEEVDEAPKKQQRIPKQRFDEINERRKTAELQIRELQAKLDAQEAKPLEDEFDFDTKEQEYMEHVLDGELDKAKVVRSEIRSAETRRYQAMATTVRDEAVEVTQARTEYMVVVNKLQSDFNEFNPEGEGFNQDLVDEVLEMKDAFISREGNLLTPGQALTKAAAYVAKMNDLKDPMFVEARIEKRVDLTKVVSKKPVNVKEKVKQSNAQPPNMEAGETDLKGSPNIVDMDDDEFEALPEATKRRLRGDSM